VFVNVMPDEIPFFVREGAVLSTYPVRQHTAEPVQELTLYVYFREGKEQSVLYEDAGEGFDYQQDAYLKSTFEVEGNEQQIHLSRQTEGRWKPTYQTIKIYLVGFPTFVRHCKVDGLSVPIKEIRLRERSLYTLQVDPNFKLIQWLA
jgi:alpha-glucosidase